MAAMVYRQTEREREKDISMTYNFGQLFTKLILNYTTFMIHLNFVLLFTQ